MQEDQNQAKDGSITAVSVTAKNVSFDIFGFDENWNGFVNAVAVVSSLGGGGAEAKYVNIILFTCVGLKECCRNNVLFYVMGYKVFSGG